MRSRRKTRKSGGRHPATPPSSTVPRRADQVGRRIASGRSNEGGSRGLSQGAHHQFKRPPDPLPSCGNAGKLGQDRRSHRTIPSSAPPDPGSCRNTRETACHHSERMTAHPADVVGDDARVRYKSMSRRAAQVRAAEEVQRVVAAPQAVVHQRMRLIGGFRSDPGKQFGSEALATAIHLVCSPGPTRSACHPAPRSNPNTSPLRTQRPQRKET